MNFNYKLLAIGGGALLSAGYGTYQFGKLTNEIKDSIEENKEARKEWNKTTEKINFVFRTADKIKDEHTSKFHYFTANSLSSKKVIVKEEFEKELIKFAAYEKGYFFNTIQENQLEKLVFDDYCHKGFVFSGTLEKIMNLKAHEDIKKGEYIRCNMALQPRVRDSSVDIIITGTRDCKACDQLVRAILVDHAVIAASQPEKIDPINVLSDTPVFDFEKHEFTEVGDLTKMPDTTRKKINSGIFRVCNSYLTRETRMSHGSFKKLPAIIAGSQDQYACEALRDATMKNLVNDRRNHNNQ